MRRKISQASHEQVWHILACPVCLDSLQEADGGAFCRRCGHIYPQTETGALDLRLPGGKRYPLVFELGTGPIPEVPVDVIPLAPNPAPEVDFGGLETPRHLTTELMSYIPKATSGDSLMLDLGCGSTTHRDLCEAAGFKYVGIDHDSTDAPLLGDAHSLPFRHESFEFILSVAVLEHIRYPFIAVREAYRVLKPGGKFVGTVAFLQPFHSGSLYHHTHLGTANLLQFGGFSIERLAPGTKWNGLTALTRMALFPGLPDGLALSLAMPLQGLHRLWYRFYGWARGSQVESLRLVTSTSGFAFVAAKAPDVPDARLPG